MAPQTSIELTAILIPDKKIGGFSAYFAEFPLGIAQGETEEEVVQNLKDLFFYMIKDQAQNPDRAEKCEIDLDNSVISKHIKVYA